MTAFVRQKSPPCIFLPSRAAIVRFVGIPGAGTGNDGIRFPCRRRDVGRKNGVCEMRLYGSPKALVIGRSCVLSSLIESLETANTLRRQNYEATELNVIRARAVVYAQALDLGEEAANVAGASVERPRLDR